MCMAAATTFPEGGNAAAGENDMFIINEDDPNKGRSLRGMYEIEKQDGKWMRSNSIEAEGWRDKQKVQTGNAPPPDMVNNQPVGETNFSLGDKVKGKHTLVDHKQLAKRKEDLKVRLKGRSSQKDMTGNITKDADLKAGGINI